MSRTKLRELSSLPGREVEQPEILAPESTKLDDDALAIGEKCVAVSKTIDEKRANEPATEPATESAP